MTNFAKPEGVHARRHSFLLITAPGLGSPRLSSGLLCLNGSGSERKGWGTVSPICGEQNVRNGWCRGCCAEMADVRGEEESKREEVRSRIHKARRGAGHEEGRSELKRVVPQHSHPPETSERDVDWKQVCS